MIRQAKCAYCKTIRDNNGNLPFFEDRGPGSKSATEHCGKCGKYDFVHQEINPATKRPGITDHKFVEYGPSEFDSYYCGCRGWD